MAGCHRASFSVGCENVCRQFADRVILMRFPSHARVYPLPAGVHGDAHYLEWEPVPHSARPPSRRSIRPGGDAARGLENSGVWNELDSARGPKADNVTVLRCHASRPMSCKKRPRGQIRRNTRTNQTKRKSSKLLIFYYLRM